MKLQSLLVVLAVAVLGAARAAPPPVSAKMFGTAIADAVEKVMPSVVVIRTEAMKDYYVRDFWSYRRWAVPMAGQGSGVVITKDGYILTNNHVIDEADKVEVVFSDGSKFPARIVGKDPNTDLAVVKIEDAKGRSFKSVQVGDSDTLRVGEFVIAAGSPLSLASSVSLGIVSAKGRTIGMLPYEDFIQTDAAINMGNSGGPLLDVDGHMVGINSVIQTAGGEGSIGIGFAIPANLAMVVARSLIKDGKWQRPWIGIAMDAADKRVSVTYVAEDGPASKAGIEVEDEILSVDGYDADTVQDVQRAILQRAAGQKVAVKVLREGKEKTLNIATEAMPPQRRRR